MKHCNKCNTTKANKLFSKSKSTNDGLYWCCKACWSAYIRRHKKESSAYRECVRRDHKAFYYRHRDRILAKNRQWWKVNGRSMYLRRAYGINAAVFEQMIVQQKSACAICGRPFKRRPVVDHDHTTKKVRGLLCCGCNTALGQFHDDPRVLRRAIRYLAA